MKALKITLISVGCVLLALLLVVGGYVLYVVLQYSRIEDNLSLQIENNDAAAQIDKNSFSIMTYNIGFGAYSTDFSFFMDSGTMKDGTAVSGTGSKAKDKETVIKNTDGAIGAAKEVNPDFLFLQETDVKSTRARGVNQLEKFTSAFTSSAYVYAENFHSAYLFYPFSDPHGKTNAGIVTLSRYKINESVRRSFPVDESFPTRFFDLDRCFSVSRINLDGDKAGKQLVLINVHLSAYDEGGLIRAKQLEMLNGVLKEERDKGNYVVAGGDFNHDIAFEAAPTENKDSLTLFESDQNVPEWVYTLKNENLAEGYSFAAALNAPTCRSTDMPYEKGVNYTVVIDGFIVSDNVRVDSVKNVDTGFEFSDHNPATMNFTLL